MESRGLNNVEIRKRQKWIRRDKSCMNIDTRTVVEMNQQFVVEMSEQINNI